MIIVPCAFRGGIRNLSTAIELVRTMVFNASNGDRARSRNVAVVFVHGVLADYPAAMRAATAARRDGITLLVVGVTGNVDRRQLDSIASYPMLANVYRVQNYYSFVNVQTGLARAVCNGMYNMLLLPVASKGNPGDAKCVTEIPTGGQK